MLLFPVQSVKDRPRPPRKQSSETVLRSISAMLSTFRRERSGPSMIYLAAIADPQHEQHEEMIEWRATFDIEAFAAKKATKEMRKVK